MAGNERRINLSVRLPNGEVRALQTSSKSTVDQVKRELLKAALIDFALRKDYVVVLCREEGQTPLDVEFRRFLESHPSMEKVEEGQTINLALMDKKQLDSKGKAEESTTQAHEESATPSPRPSLSSSISSATISSSTSTPAPAPAVSSTPSPSTATPTPSVASELSQQVKELQGKIEELEALRKENAELKARIETSECAVADSSNREQEIDRLRKEVEALKATKEAQETQESEMLQEDNTRLRADLEKALASASIRSSDLESLQSEVRSLKQQVDALVSTNQTLSAEKEQLLTERNADNSKDMNRSRELEGELESFKQQHSLLKTEVESLQQQLIEKERGLSILKSEVDSKESLMKERTESLAQEVETFKSQLRQLQAESANVASDSTSANEALLKELETLRQQNKVLEDERQRSSKESTSSDDKASALQNSLQQLQEEREKLAAENNELKASQEQLKEENEKKVQELQEELKRLKEEREKLGAPKAIEECDTTKSSQELEIEQLRDEKAKLEAENARLQAARDDPLLVQSLTLLRSESERLTLELTRLEQQLKESQQTADELRAAAEARESQRIAGEEAQQEVIVLKSRVAELEKDNSRLEESLHTRTEELAKAVEETKYLEETKEAFVDEIEKYENALKGIQDKMVDAESKRQRICNLAEKIESELHTCYQSKQSGQNNTHPVNGKQVLRRMYAVLIKIRDSQDFNMNDFSFIENREKKRLGTKKVGAPKKAPSSVGDAGQQQKVVPTAAAAAPAPVSATAEAETPKETPHIQESEAQPSGEEPAAAGTGVSSEIEVSLQSGGLDPKWRVNYSEISLSRVIGEGAFGQVYKGIFRNQEVAIKLIKIGAETPDFKEDFVKEVTFLSTLDHPNIVKFVGVCTEEPNLAILTQYAAKGSLSSMLRSEKIRLPWTLRLKFCIDVACGMNYLHSLSPKIIHRDLKSDNILISEDLVAQVADFGLAKLKTNTFRRETSKRNLLQMLGKQNSYINVITGAVGTPAWIAPEILSWQPYNEKADIYSYGMFLWEVWCQKIPMAGKSQYSLMMDVMTLGERPDIPGDCPPKYAELINVCWDQNASKRPDFPAVLEKLKDILLEEEARHAEPSTGPLRPSSPPPGAASPGNTTTAASPAGGQQAGAAGGQPPLRKWFRHYKDSTDKVNPDAPTSPPSKTS